MAQRLDPDDQASGLRRLLGGQNTFRPVGLFGPDTDLNAAAASGLGFALAQRGAHTCVIDEAPAPRNVAGQLGLTPHLGLTDVAQGVCALDEAWITLEDGPHLLDGSQGIARIADSDDRHWSRLAEDFAAEHWDWLLLSAPAEANLCLALTAPLRILVLPATKSRLAEAYATLKSAHQSQPDAVWFALLINAADDGRADEIMAAINETAQRFLGVEIAPLGMIPKDAKLDRAMRSMQPLHRVDAAAPATLAFRHAASQLQEIVLDGGMDAKTYWQRMGVFSRLNKPTLQPANRPTQHGRVYG